MTSGSGESKMHHYVPQSLLRGFAVADSREHVQVFDKKTGRVFRAAIAEVGAENQYNRVTHGDRKANFEPNFNRHDTKLAELLRRIRETGRLACLSADDRVEMAYAASVQMLRVKLVRKTLSTLPQQLRKIFEEAGAEWSDELLPEMGEDSFKPISLRMVSNAERFVPAFLQKDWLLHSTTPAQPFWISDCPIVKHNLSPWGALGVESRGVTIAWPLSSQLVLTFHCPSIAASFEQADPLRAAAMRGSITLTSPPEKVLFFNSLQVFQSWRWLYGSCSNFSDAEMMLNEHPDAREVETTMEPMGAGQMPPSPMPAGKWLVMTGVRTDHCCAVEQWRAANGRLEVTVSQRDEATLQRAVADSPIEQVQMFDSERGDWMHRGADVRTDATRPRVVMVTPAGPPVRADSV